MRVAAVQLAGTTDGSAWDLAPVTASIDEAAAAGAELIVLPELATTPYFCLATADRYPSWARPVDAPELRVVAGQTERLGVVVVLPFFETDADGTPHNASVVFDRGRLVPGRDALGREHLVDEKVHLPVGTEPPPAFDEAAHFASGRSFNVHALDRFRLGTLICYDRRFPESWRMMRSLGADVVAVPVAGAGDDPEGFFVAELRTHARENGVFAVAASKVGHDVIAGTPIAHVGESCVVSPEGRVLAHRGPDEGPGIVLADVDLESLPQLRRGIGLFDERRLDLFGERMQVRARRDFVDAGGVTPRDGVLA